LPDEIARYSSDEIDPHQRVVAFNGSPLSRIVEFLIRRTASA
jgi:hypothetical protein